MEVSSCLHNKWLNYTVSQLLSLCPLQLSFKCSMTHLSAFLSAAGLFCINSINCFSVNFNRIHYIFLHSFAIVGPRFPVRNDWGYFVVNICLDFLINALSTVCLIYRLSLDFHSLIGNVDWCLDVQFRVALPINNLSVISTNPTIIYNTIQQ